MNQQVPPLASFQVECEYGNAETPPPTYEQACFWASTFADQPSQLTQVTHISPRNDQSDRSTDLCGDQVIANLPQTQHSDDMRWVETSMAEFIRPPNLPHNTHNDIQDTIGTPCSHSYSGRFYIVLVLVLGFMFAWILYLYKSYITQYIFNTVLFSCICMLFLCGSLSLMISCENKRIENLRTEHL